MRYITAARFGWPERGGEDEAKSNGKIRKEVKEKKSQVTRHGQKIRDAECKSLRCR